MCTAACLTHGHPRCSKHQLRSLARPRLGTEQPCASPRGAHAPLLPTSRMHTENMNTVHSSFAIRAQWAQLGLGLQGI